MPQTCLNYPVKKGPSSCIVKEAASPRRLSRVARSRDVISDGLSPRTRSRTPVTPRVATPTKIEASPRKRSTRSDLPLSAVECSPSKRKCENQQEGVTKSTPQKQKHQHKAKSPRQSPRQQRPPLSPIKGAFDSVSNAAHSPKHNQALRNVMKSPIRNLPRHRNLLSAPMEPSPVKGSGASTLLGSPIRNVPRIRRNILDAPIMGSPIKDALASPCGKAIPSKCPRVRHSSSAKKLFTSPVKENVPTPGKSGSASRKLDFLDGQSCPTPEKAPLKSSSSVRSLNFSPERVGRSPLRLAKREGVCYQRAKQALHATLPDQLIGREKEEEVVRGFLNQHLDKQKAGSLYISGAPGTGKTAMLSHMLGGVVETKTPTIYINCMSVTSSQAIYNKVAGELKKKKTLNLSIKDATVECEKVLTSKGPMVLLVLDEVDQLDSKNQEVLYTMFEWPFMAKSRLVLVGIANALDLTQRVLPRLQGKKCRPQLLNFPPYTKDQIASAVKCRLEKVEVDGHIILEPSAVEFCARKVAAVAGDMRKALDICRRAVEVVESEVSAKQAIEASKSPKKPIPKKITVATIAKIVDEVYGSRVVCQTRTVPLQHKLAICSLLLLTKHTKGKREIVIGKFHDVYTKVCKKQEVQSVDQAEFVNMCNLIEAHGILAVKKGKDARSSKVFLKLDETELEDTLQDKTLLSVILNNGLPR